MQAIKFVVPECESGLPASVVHERLMMLGRGLERAEVVAAFYLLDVETRGIHRDYGRRTTADYAEAFHGINPHRTYRLLRAARACKRSPVLKAAFERGEVSYSKVNVIKPLLKGTEADAEWVEKAATLSRARLTIAVDEARGLQPATIVKRLEFTADEWQLHNQAKEKASRVAGRDLSWRETFEMTSVEFINMVVDESEVETIDETSCTGADRAFRLGVIERDGWRCVACDKRHDLQVDHIKPRGRFPLLRRERSNGATLCFECHAMKTDGILRLTRLDDGSVRIERPA